MSFFSVRSTVKKKIKKKKSKIKTKSKNVIPEPKQLNEFYIFEVENIGRLAYVYLCVRACVE